MTQATQLGGEFQQHREARELPDQLAMTHGPALATPHETVIVLAMQPQRLVLQGVILETPQPTLRVMPLNTHQGHPHKREMFQGLPPLAAPLALLQA
jgi:hypothetical protein